MARRERVPRRRIAKTISKGSDCGSNLESQPKHQRQAAHLLRKVMHEAFADRTLWVYYVYSPTQPRSSHFYSGTNDVVITIHEDQQTLDEYLCLLYECLNSENQTAFQEIFHKAELGSITKSDFAREILRHEYSSAMKVKLLISQLGIPKGEASKSFYYEKFSECPGTFEGFLASVKKESARGKDAISGYESQYDSLRKH